MPIVLALLLAFSGGFDVGGHVASAWPAGSLGRFHSSAAMLGATAGWSVGRLRLSANYDYSSLPGRASLPYRLLLHIGRAELSAALVDRPGWDFGPLAGGGFAFGTREFGAGSETGPVPCGHWGLSLSQQAGRSRVSLGLTHTMFAGSVAGRGPGLDHLLGLRVGVGYAP
ncbi:MAG: hypothetical protein R6X14_02780 [bacterium]